MYDIIKEITPIDRFVIIDFTKFSGEEAYSSENTRIIEFDLDSIEYKSFKSDPWRNLRGESGDAINSGMAMFRCPGELPGTLMIYNDYGNHEGGALKKEFPEEILFPGLTLGDDSVCYFEDCISVCYRLGSRVMIYKLHNEVLSEDQLWLPNRKRPTNLLYYHDDTNPHVLVFIRDVGDWDITVPIEISTVTDIDWLAWILRI